MKNVQTLEEIDEIALEAATIPFPEND